MKITSAGIIPIHFSKSHSRVLLLRVYNYWDFPKGVVEEGELPKDCAIRELEEETGITDAVFAWGYEFYETETYGNNKTAKYFIAKTDTEKVVLKPNEKTGVLEHHEFRWCSFDEAEKLLSLRVRKALKWAITRLEQG